jgi:hypothetical protein
MLPIRIILFFFATALAISCDFAHAIDLYILGGQSNAQGYGSNADDYPEDPIDLKIRFYWFAPFLSQSGGWVHLQPQGGIFPHGHFGPEISLARQAAKKIIHRVAIFKFTVGTTSLYKNWRVGDDNGYFSAFIYQMDAAREQLRTEDNVIINRCFIWIQGESDAENDVMSNAYEDNLKKLIAIIRGKLGKNIRIVLGVDEQFPWVKKNPQVLMVQKNMTKHDRNIRFVSMIGLPKTGVTHLTAKGVIQHGERIFNACQSR